MSIPTKLLSDRWEAVLVWEEKEVLPGSRELVTRDDDYMKAFRDMSAEFASAIGSDDAHLFDEVFSRLRKFWGQVNAKVADAYRAENPDPESWELRYFKWMTGVRFLRMDVGGRDLFIVRHPPRRLPKSPHWLTVDELLDILGSSVAMEAIKIFKALPTRKEYLKGPGAEEKHLHVRVEGETVTAKYDFNWEERSGELVCD